jgi:hypothetical protein
VLEVASGARGWILVVIRRRHTATELLPACHRLTVCRLKPPPPPPPPPEHDPCLRWCRATEAATCGYDVSHIRHEMMGGSAGMPPRDDDHRDHPKNIESNELFGSEGEITVYWARRTYVAGSPVKMHNVPPDYQSSAKSTSGPKDKIGICSAQIEKNGYEFSVGPQSSTQSARPANGA